PKAAQRRDRQAGDRADADPAKVTSEQLGQVATGNRLTFLLGQVDALRKDGVHQRGNVSVKKILVPSASLASGSKAPQVLLSACLDNSQRTYVDGSGKPVLTQPG